MQVHKATIDAGAYPSPLNYYHFPKSVCTSVNEVRLLAFAAATACGNPMSPRCQSLQRHGTSATLDRGIAQGSFKAASMVAAFNIT